MMRVFSTKRMRFGLVSVLVSLLILSFSAFNVQAATVGITVDVTTDTGGAGCELREAIRSANTEVAQPGCTFSVAPTAGADDFVITIDPALFPAVINLNSELPDFVQPIRLVGGDVTVDDIIIRPSGAAGTLTYGIRLSPGSGDSRIEGMVIDGFVNGVEVVNVADNALLGTNTQIGVAAANGANKIINNVTGILIRGGGSDNISVLNNIIGIDETLTPVLAGNSQDGIRVVDAQNITIGSAAGPNIIGGNGRYGIFLDDVATVTVIENRIGRSPIAANVAAPNGASGIRIAGGSSDVLIDSNVIGSNGGNGVLVGNSTNSVVSNNFIGETLLGDIAGNGSAGIWINTSRVEVTGNTIAHNDGNGVTVRTGIRNEISQNLIFNNGNLGIDLNNDSLTQNDFDDPDAGANASQNFPGISAAWVVGATLFIDGRMNALPGSYTFEIYNNPSGCNPPTNAPRYGEGEVYEQSATVGNGPFSLALPAGSFAAGDILTILAIAGNGNTSEFSRCETVLAAPPTATPTPTNTPIPVIPTTIVPAIPSDTPTVTPSPTPTNTATSTPSRTATNTPSPTPTNTATSTPSRTATNTATSTPSRTATNTPTITPSRTATNTATSTPSRTPSSTPTMTISPSPTASPDLDITKVSDGNDDVEINVVNNGDSTAPDVIVIEDLRDDVEYRAASAGDASCLESAGIVTCYVGDIPAGATAQVNVNVDGNGVDPASGQTIVIVNGMTVAIVDEPYIIKVGNPPVAAPGAEITYTIRVINPTTESAFEMLIEDEMPEGIEIISASSTAGDLVIDGQSVRLSLEELAPGERVTITLITRVSDEEVFPQIINTACVTSSSNPAPRCAQMSFLRAGQLPTTGETPLSYRLLLWGSVALIATLMLAGLAFFWRRIQAS